MTERCPYCNRRFSDWFIWGGYCHCYPCWQDSGFRSIVLEKAGMQAARDGKLNLCTGMFLKDKP